MLQKMEEAKTEVGKLSYAKNTLLLENKEKFAFVRNDLLHKLNMEIKLMSSGKDSKK